jgi:hypothetical protein
MAFTGCPEEVSMAFTRCCGVPPGKSRSNLSGSSADFATGLLRVGGTAVVVVAAGVCAMAVKGRSVVKRKATDGLHFFTGRRLVFIFILIHVSTPEILQSILRPPRKQERNASRFGAENQPSTRARFEMAARSPYKVRPAKISTA